MNDPLKQLRRKFRIWRNQVRLENEGRSYESRFAALNLKIPDDDSIKSSVKSKFPFIKAKNKGDLNVLAIYHNYNWEEESLRPALEKFGKLYTCDWMEPIGNQNYHKNWDLISKINSSLLEKAGDLVKKEKIDVIFCYLSGEQLLPDTALALRSFKIPLINLALNDKEHFVGKSRFGQARGSRASPYRDPIGLLCRRRQSISPDRGYNRLLTPVFNYNGPVRGYITQVRGGVRWRLPLTLQAS